MFADPVYLIDDGIDLWLSVILNATALSHTLAALLPLAPPLLAYGSDNLKGVIKVIQAYVLLAPQQALSLTADICAHLVPLVSNMKPEGVSVILSLLDTILLVSHLHSVRILDALHPVTSEVVRIVAENTEMGYILARYCTFLARYFPSNKESLLSTLIGGWLIVTLQLLFQS